LGSGDLWARIWWDFCSRNGAGAGLVRDLTRVENLHAVCAKVRLFEADVCEAACGEAIVADVRAASHGANGAN